METKKRILVTGVAGMLGSNIAYLLKDIYTIIGMDIEPVHIPNVKSYLVNMIETEQVEKIILLERPDVVIHCVAMVNVDECEQKPELAYAINVGITKQLVKLCEPIKCKLIYISTDAVFDGLEEGLYEEMDKAEPVSIYGKTKLEGEKITLSNSDNLVLRTNIYGFNSMEKKSFGEWILSELSEGNTLRMFEDVKFSPILVNDMAEIINKLINHESKGIYHVCGTGSINKYAFGIALKEIFGLKKGEIQPISVETFHFKAKRTKNMGMSNQKICNELEIKVRSPKASIEEFRRLYQEGYPDILKEFRREKGEDNEKL